MTENLKNQHGATLILVLAIMVVVIILGFAAMSIADNQTIMVNQHQQREKALHYAEAGIHSYMSELNKDFDFYKTEASDNMQKKNINFEEGYYCLEIDNPTSESPYISIRSTGGVINSNIRRTVEVQLAKRSFLNNVITSNVGSDKFWYTNRFIRGDVINGPLHMNGDLVIDGYHGEGQTGPLFTGPVTYSGDFYEIVGVVSNFIDAIDVLNWLPDTNSTVDILPGYPVKIDRAAIPSTNNYLKQKADYVFKGRTCIHLEESIVKVKDKDGNETEITIPTDGLVIYVKGGLGNNKWGKETANVYISGVLNGKLTVAAENDIYITATDPTNWNAPGEVQDSGGITYKKLASANYSNQAELDTALADCNDMLGLIANRNVSILHYNWPKDDGKWHGGSTIVGWIDVAPTNMNIHASICAATGSFEYEEHLLGGAKGNLTVIGSITQYKTGPIAGYGPNIMDLPDRYDLLNKRLSGYGKNYWHDPRLLYQTPPDFLDSGNAGWEMLKWQEIANPVIAEP